MHCTGHIFTVQLVEVAVFLHATSGLYNWPRSFTLCELERAVLMPAASNVAHHVLSALLKQRRGFPTREKEAYVLVYSLSASLRIVLCKNSLMAHDCTIAISIHLRIAHTSHSFSY